MARPRTPTNVLQLRGAFKKDPQRARARQNEPEPKAGIGSAPDWMAADAKAAWDYLVSIALPGVLGDSDRAYLEVAAELLALKRRVGLENIKAAKLGLLDRMLSKLGLNPADRSRVTIGGKPSAPAQRGNNFRNL